MTSIDLAGKSSSFFSLIAQVTVIDIKALHCITLSHCCLECWQPRLRYPLLLGLALHLAQQFSGINAVFYYSSSFFEKARVDDPWLGSVMAGALTPPAFE